MRSGSDCVEGGAIVCAIGSCNYKYKPQYDEEQATHPGGRRKERRLKERYGCAYLRVDDDDGSMIRWLRRWNEQEILSINNTFCDSQDSYAWAPIRIRCLSLAAALWLGISGRP